MGQRCDRLIFLRKRGGRGSWEISLPERLLLVYGFSAARELGTRKQKREEEEKENLVLGI